MGEEVRLLRCTTCKKDKPEEDFANAKNARGRQYNCKPCANEFARDNYNENSERYKKTTTDRHNELRRWVNEAKAVPCMDCGQRYPHYVMDFDHVTNDKAHNISYMIRHRMAWKKIEAEIAKCEAVCSNCHRQRTHDRGQTTIYEELI